jgi:hypothetical protein
MKNRFVSYRVGEEGITNLLTGEVLEFSTITAVKIDADEITIDTTKYQNDLVIKADILHSPTWIELVTIFSNLDKTRN